MKGKLLFEQYRPKKRIFQNKRCHPLMAVCAYEGIAKISIYVDKAYQRRHLGRQLLSEALGMTASLDIKIVVGFIFPTTPRA